MKFPIKAFEPNFISTLKQLRGILPRLNRWENFQPWWQANGSQWSEQFRKAILKHRNICHDWQFTKEQKQQLQRYYNANKFLVDLLNIEGAVTKETRAEIEDSLLLPWEELQRRYPGLYRDENSQ